MPHDLKTPTTTTTTNTTMVPDDIDSACSTPYVSAPSSPCHVQPLSCYYYSAPSSPMHLEPPPPPPQSSPSPPPFEFDFSPKLKTDNATSSAPIIMSSADELFFNGKIRPLLKLSTHLQHPQTLPPLLNLQEIHKKFEDKDRGRDVTSLLHRRTRSLSPHRSITSFEWQQDPRTNETTTDVVHIEEDEVLTSNYTTPSDSGTSSRSSSLGRSSKRWIFLKEFLYRSKSEGRNNNGETKMVKIPKMRIPPLEQMQDSKKRVVVNGVMKKRRVPPSAHELHYTANRAHAEEMRKKTLLPYRPGLFGCLGFNSKSYGIWSGFSKAMNPVSSR